MKIETGLSLPHAPPPGMRITDRIEAMFLQEMLKSARIGQAGTVVGGGIGEEQFSSFLTEEYARILSGRIDLDLRVGGEG